MAGGAQPLKTSLSPALQCAFSYQPPLTLRAATSTVKRKSTETETKKKYPGTAGDAYKNILLLCSWAGEAWGAEAWADRASPWC